MVWSLINDMYVHIKEGNIFHVKKTQSIKRYTFHNENENSTAITIN